MLRSTAPPASVVKTGFEKTAVPVSVTPDGGIVAGAELQRFDEQLQPTSNGAVPAVTGIAEADPPVNVIAPNKGRPMNNLRIKITS